MPLYKTMLKNERSKTMKEFIKNYDTFRFITDLLSILTSIYLTIHYGLLFPSRPLFIM